MYRKDVNDYVEDAHKNGAREFLHFLQRQPALENSAQMHIADAFHNYCRDLDKKTQERHIQKSKNLSV